MREIYEPYQNLTDLEIEREIFNLRNKGWDNYILNLDGENYEVVEKDSIIRIVKVL